MVTKPHIVIGRFSEESNSFNPLPCDLTEFQSTAYCEGEEILNKYRGSKDMTSGIIAAVEENGGICIPTVYMQSRSSSGAVTADAVDYFVEKVLQTVQNQPQVDGIFLDFHGGTQGIGDKYEDACGYILKQIRNAVGSQVVITVACDLHANITDAMIENADFISGYQTYPHIDIYQTGYRSACLGMDKLAGGAHLYTARVSIPMIVPASGYSNTYGAFKEVTDLAHNLAEKYQVADFSIFQMQPWLDVKDASSNVLVTAEDPQAAANMAQEVAQKLFDLRHEYMPQLTSIDDVIRKAYENKKDGPVVLADMADSPNGGAVGDSVAVLIRMKALGLPISACTVVRDIAATEKAFAVGAGNESEFTFGGTLTPGGESITVKAKVVSLHDGTFTQEGPASRGRKRDIGKTAVITYDKVFFVLCQRPAGTGDPQIYRHFGIEPTELDLVAVKANTSFRGAYEPIAAEIYLADTPGACQANLKSLPYKRLDTANFYPFNSLDSFRLPKAKIY